jgi:hypothetical protein
VVLAGAVVLLCVGCTALTFLTVAVNGPSVYATETAEAHAQSTVGVLQAATREAALIAAQTAAPTQTAEAAAANAAVSTQSADRAIQATVVAQATSAAAPTATPRPSFGSTIPNLNDWTISLAKMEHRDTLTWSEFGNRLAPSGVFWVLWVDAKNLRNESRGLQGTLDWELVDDHSAHYSEISAANPVSLAGFVRLQDRDTLNANVTPRAVTHPLLVFDVAADAQPVQLLVKSAALFSGDQVVFDLSTEGQP